jgi:phage FluMu protein Com
MKQEIEIRCDKCGKYLLDVICPDSSDYDFAVRKICPRCKEKNLVKILKFKRIQSPPCEAT